jgi:hypothetical protein
MNLETKESSAPMDRKQIQKNSDDSLQKLGLAHMNFIRWLCFIPGGMSVGALVVFVCLLVGMFPYAILPPKMLSFLSRVPVHICILAAVFGFCATTFGAEIAPSKNKKIAGGIMAFALGLVFISDYDINFLDQPESFVKVFKIVAVLISVIPAFFSRNVESANLTDLNTIKIHDDGSILPEMSSSSSYPVAQDALSPNKIKSRQTIFTTETFFGKKFVHLIYALAFPFLLYIHGFMRKDMSMYANKNVPLLIHAAYAVLCLFSYFVIPRALLFMPIVAGVVFIYFRG